MPSCINHCYIPVSNNLIHSHLYAHISSKLWFFYSIAWIYVNAENSFPFGYNLSELIKCLQRDSYRIYYGLRGSISVALSEGYGQKHQQFRSLMKTIIAQEGYSIDNYQSLSLLTASYATETASILIKALSYLITEQHWNHSLIKPAMRNIEQLTIKQRGVTGTITIDGFNNISSTFVVYNIIPSSSDEAPHTEARAYMFYAKSSIQVQYIDGRGVNSTSPTIVYADGTTTPPWSTPEQFLIPNISKKNQ